MASLPEVTCKGFFYIMLTFDRSLRKAGWARTKHARRPENAISKRDIAPKRQKLLETKRLLACPAAPQTPMPNS